MAWWPGWGWGRGWRGGWGGWGRGWGWRGPWPGNGPFSYLPPWERPGWVYGPGWCWRAYGAPGWLVWGRGYWGGYGAWPGWRWAWAPWWY